MCIFLNAQKDGDKIELAKLAGVFSSRYIQRKSLFFLFLFCFSFFFIFTHSTFFLCETDVMCWKE